VAIKLIGKIQDSRVSRRIKSMTPKEQEEYLNDLEGKSKKPKILYEKIIIVIGFALLGFLAIGSIVGIVYYLFT
jgi:hypothetical protein